MKLRRLSLLRYGHLHDLVLDFPPEAALCVVVGPNEAGKSTALAALGDALFGFGHKSAYGFLHGLDKLRVGITLLSDGGSEASFVRRKGRGSTLYDEHDEALPESALHAFLGGASRETFETMFGLNGERLRSGGADLAEGGGSVGESLFAAGTGLVGLRAALGQLDSEAKKLVGDGRGDRRVSESVKAWREAHGRADTLAVPPKQWHEAEEAHARAEQELKQVQARSVALAGESRRLQRIRRVAPLLVGIDGARERLRELADAPRLAPDAVETLARLRAGCQQAERDRARESGEVERLAEDRAKLPRNVAILAFQESIQRLGEQRAVVSNARADLPGARAAVEQARQIVGQALAYLPPGLTPEAAREAIPAAPARASVQTLLSRHASVVTAAAAANSALADAVAARDQAEAALKDRAEPADPSLLRGTIDDARGEGRLDAELAQADVMFAEAHRQTATALAALSLWQGDAAALAGCPVPLPAQVAGVAAQLDRAETTLAEGSKGIATLAGELARLEDDLSRLARGETVPTTEAVGQARGERDRVWQSVRRVLDGAAPAPADDLPPGERAEAYERLVAQADRLADRRADEAQRVADYLAALGRQALVRKRHAEALDERAKAEAARTEAWAAWRALWAPAGIEAATPAAMTEWVQDRDGILKLARGEAEAGRQRDAIAARREAARKALLPFLPDSPADESLAALLRRADAACTSAEKAVQTYRTDAEAAKRENASLPRLESALTKAREKVDLWRAEWGTAVETLGLGADARIETAQAALDAWARIAEQARGWRTDELRVEQMTGAIAAFEDELRAVVRALGIAEGDEGTLVTATRLASDLAAARNAEREFAALGKRIAQHEAAAREAEEKRRTADAEIVALRLLARVEDESGLDDAIRRAHERDAAEKEAGELRHRLVEQGEGFDEAALRAEADGIDPDGAGARLDEIERESDALGARREELSADRTKAQAALDDMRRGHDAAAAAQDARNALADATAAAERYARLHVARTLLRAGIDRFRRDQQAPLLRAAGQSFSRLTGGHYQRLVTDDGEGDRRRLLAVATDGTECPVDGLSDGARDQLYLALRLAVVREQVAGAARLPFIGDDLLVHFDDARASAAIAELAELGHTTQAILFTHHDHIAALAAAQAASGVAVVRFGAGDAEAARLSSIVPSLAAAAPAT